MSNGELKKEKEQIFAEIFDGLDQLLEATSYLKASNKYKTNFVPAVMMWEAKEDAYKEVKNLLAMVAKRTQPHPETEWGWKE